jgi:hypothetical protein
VGSRAEQKVAAVDGGEGERKTGPARKGGWGERRGGAVAVEEATRPKNGVGDEVAVAVVGRGTALRLPAIRCFCSLRVVQ